MTTTSEASATVGQPVTFLELEITTRCPLECVHCYNSSGPDGTHGTMTTADWLTLIDQAAAHGITQVQLIGGEPTMHPDLSRLIEHALAAGLTVEVYTNLVHISDDLWKLLSRDGVELATSWYSDDPAQHQQITGRNTYERTRSNIIQALCRQIPLFVNITEVLDGQRAREARQLLVDLGVDRDRINLDRTRRLGRAAQGDAGDPSKLCGGCGHGRAAVLPDGSMTPCPPARWMVAGDVRVTPIDALLDKVRESAVIIRDAVGGGACGSCGPNDGGPCGPNGSP